MEEHVIVETVGGYRVVGIVGLVGNPVLVQFLRAKHQYRLVAQLVILDDSQGCKSLAETHGIGKDATMVFLHLRLQSFEGVDGEGSGSNGNLRA